MINHWWVTRPKRKLTSIPQILATVADTALDTEWTGHVSTHLSMENALEQAGLKRVGDRRDQGGGGGRTFIAWLKSLGLIFTQEATGLLKLTLAGEAILNGEPPVEIMKWQVLKYQFPSNFSIGRGVDVSPRFKIHPFKFLLLLLRDPRLGYYLTQDELAKVVLVEADNETSKCYNYVVSRIIMYRQYGNVCLDPEFGFKYSSNRSEKSENIGSGIFDRLRDVANTMINWLEYTQLIYRENSQISIAAEKVQEVDRIINTRIPFIDRPENEEYFQRKYGIDPWHQKDTRNLMDTRTMTQTILAERHIKNTFVIYSTVSPIFSITPVVVDRVSELSGCSARMVEDVLLRIFPNGAIGSFMTEYYAMAFNGRKEATDFENATAQIFENIFGYVTRHVGPMGLTPDVHVISDRDMYQGIIDNKAYSAYSISNDHHNRMVDNYIGNIRNYSLCEFPLAFFTYIAGGFSNSIDRQIESITAATGVRGSAVTVNGIIKMVDRHRQRPYSHAELREIFSVGREVTISDL